MKPKPKKTKAPSSLDRLALAEENIRQLYELLRGMDNKAAEEEKERIINEWAKRAVTAESSLEHANKALDQFKREDEARATTIREIVRPLGLEYVAPMDAVRELAKAYFSLRDAAQKEQAEKEAYIKSRLDQRASPPDAAPGQCWRCGGSKQRSREETLGSPGDHPCPECSPREGSKPLRLLVEIVPKKDERHGLSASQRKEVDITCIHDRAMSVQELPPMPTIEECYKIFLAEYDHGRNTECGHLARVYCGLRALFAACGLEVGE